MLFRSIFYADYHIANDGCSLGQTATGTAASDTDLNVTYPINQVVATAYLYLDSPYTIRITLTNNLTAGTGGTLANYQGSIDGGAWATLSTLITDLGSGSYNWLPSGPATLRIRAINAIGTTSQYIGIGFASGGGSTMRLVMGLLGA